jgi:hypothetical protein
METKPNTDNPVVPVTPPSLILAEMAVLPLDSPTDRPEVSIDATAGFEEVHVSPVRSIEVPSLNVPVAVNCTPPSTGMEEFAGLMAIAARFLKT